MVKKKVKKKRTRQQAGRGARSKGQSFERKMAKILSPWSSMTLKRTPRSGAFSRTGDITPKSPEEQVKFVLNVECKCNEQLSLPGIHTLDEKNVVWKWWRQADEESKESQREPILIFTKSRAPIFVMMHEVLFNNVGGEFRIDRYMVNGNFRIMVLEDFLKIPYSAFEKLRVKENGKKEKGKKEGKRSGKSKEGSRRKIFKPKSKRRKEEKQVRSPGKKLLRR